MIGEVAPEEGEELVGFFLRRFLFFKRFYCLADVLLAARPSKKDGRAAYAVARGRTDARHMGQVVAHLPDRPRGALRETERSADSVFAQFVESLGILNGLRFGRSLSVPVSVSTRCRRCARALDEVEGARSFLEVPAPRD